MKELKYNESEILSAIRNLEKELIGRVSYKRKEETNEIINYYLDNKMKYKENLMIEGALEELGFEYLMTELKI